jgi:predicted XRE-type DNA-binding protein
MPKRPKIEVSSGNVYADLGFANPELERAKADLAREIRSIIDIRGMTQVAAGDLLGVDQADISRITRGRLGSYSLERLITILSRLNMRVEIRVLPCEESELNSSVSVPGKLQSTSMSVQEASLARGLELVGTPR